MFTGIKLRFTQLLITTAIIASCNNQKAPEQPATDTTAQAATMESSTPSFPVSMVNNKKDPTCGMPVTAGISDTAHYKDKVIGFCSTECKDEFKKAPDANIAAAEIQ
jgi:YHS domain-containing protein